MELFVVHDCLSTRGKVFSTTSREDIPSSENLCLQGTASRSLLHSLRKNKQRLVVPCSPLPRPTQLLRAPHGTNFLFKPSSMQGSHPVEPGELPTHHLIIKCLREGEEGCNTTATQLDRTTISIHIFRYPTTQMVCITLMDPITLTDLAVPTVPTGSTTLAAPNTGDGGPPLDCLPALVTQGLRWALPIQGLCKDLRYTGETNDGDSKGTMPRTHPQAGAITTH